MKLRDASKAWPPGYRFAFGGEKEEQAKGFGSMSIAMVVSVLAIYLALVLQFNSLTKPLVVFAAVPFGMVGGLMGLLIFDVPLGFFALLGLSSLAGVIISHVIILFEYIEEAHQRGEPLRRAVIDAALVRLRPVLVTVLATVGGLIPLAIKGGPLWEPLCYVQIMGLLVATLVTKIVVPVLYVLFVEDFKLIKWSAPGEQVDERTARNSNTPSTLHAPHDRADHALGQKGHSIIGWNPSRSSPQRHSHRAATEGFPDCLVCLGAEDGLFDPRPPPIKRRYSQACPLLVDGVGMLAELAPITASVAVPSRAMSSRSQLAGGALERRNP